MGYAVIHAEGNRLLTARDVSIWMHLSGEASAASNHAVNPRVWTIAGNVMGSPVKMLSTMGVEEGFDPAPKLEQCRQWACEKKE